MISYRTKRFHAWSQINRIFSRMVFLERRLGVSVFSSLFMWGGTSPVGGDLEWKSQRKNHFKKMGFPFAGSHLPRRKFIWSNDLLFSFLVSFIDRELFCFPPILPFLLSSDLRSGILLFLFFSFFSFLPFLFFSLSSDLWLGIRVLAFVIRSPLRRFCCPLLRGKGWGFFSWDEVQSSLRLCLNMVFSLCVPDFDIWGETDWCVGCRFRVKLSYHFHEARVTMMIWKQRAQLVMCTTRWVLKHPVYGIVILRLGIYASRPNVSKLCSFIGSTNASILISVILEYKLLASVSCFQKICLLSTNDLCLLWP